MISKQSVMMSADNATTGEEFTESFVLPQILTSTSPSPLSDTGSQQSTPDPAVDPSAPDAEAGGKTASFAEVFATDRSVPTATIVEPPAEEPAAQEADSENAESETAEEARQDSDPDSVAASEEAEDAAEKPLKTGEHADADRLPGAPVRDATTGLTAGNTDKRVLGSAGATAPVVTATLPAQSPARNAQIDQTTVTGAAVASPPKTGVEVPEAKVPQTPLAAPTGAQTPGNVPSNASRSVQQLVTENRLSLPPEQPTLVARYDHRAPPAQTILGSYPAADAPAVPPAPPTGALPPPAGTSGQTALNGTTPAAHLTGTTPPQQESAALAQRSIAGTPEPAKTVTGSLPAQAAPPPGLPAQRNAQEAARPVEPPQRLPDPAAPASPVVQAGRVAPAPQPAQAVAPVVFWHPAAKGGSDPEARRDTGLGEPLPSDPRLVPLPGQTASNVAPTRHDLPLHVARQLAEAVQQQPNRPVEIMLKPQELGAVRLSVHPAETGILVNLTAERPETLDLMRRHIDQLGQAFQALGYANIAFSFAQQGRQDDTARPETYAEAEENQMPLAAENATHIHLATGVTGGVDLRL